MVKRATLSLLRRLWLVVKYLFIATVWMVYPVVITWRGVAFTLGFISGLSCVRALTGAFIRCVKWLWGLRIVRYPLALLVYPFIYLFRFIKWHRHKAHLFDAALVETRKRWLREGFQSRDLLRLGLEHGVTVIITFGILFPIMLFIMITSVTYGLFMRDMAVIETALDMGVRVAYGEDISSSAKATMERGGKEERYLEYYYDREIKASGYRRKTELLSSRCQGVAPQYVRELCFDMCEEGEEGCDAFWGKLVNSRNYNPKVAVVPKGTKAHLPYHGIRSAKNIVELPFIMYEPSSEVPSYNLVQNLPQVCIKRGCAEPFNEGGGNVFDVKGRETDCRQGDIQPICWYLPVKVDLDGDGAEDPLFFTPNGPHTNYFDWEKWNPQFADFIGYYSGVGYDWIRNFDSWVDMSWRRGGGAIEDIPVVADYDRDGKSDFAVYLPEDKELRVLFSISRGRIYTSVYLGRVPSGPGVVAIPGVYKDDGSNEMQIMFIDTAGVRDERYKPYLVTPFHGVDLKRKIRDMMERNLRGFAGDLISGPAKIEVLKEDFFRPHRGRAAAIAFGDYNDDGIVEMGYLSYDGGNLSKVVGGRIEESDTLFQGSGGNPYSVRMNPFDVESDSAGNLYYLDSVSGRIWAIVSRGSEPVDGAFGERVEAVTGSNREEGIVSKLEDERRFPRYNVLNVPPVEPFRNNPSSARYLVMNSPRRMSIAKLSDGAMYVSDFGNGRILRLKRSGSGFSDVKVVVGCMENDRSKCRSLSSVPLPLQNRDGAFRKLLINPIAVAVVPSTLTGGIDTYDLVFSDGNGVYIIRHRGNGGPDGEGCKGRGCKEDSLELLSGSVSDIASQGVVNYATERLGGYWGGGEPNRGAKFCPIVDLAFDYFGYLSQNSVGNREFKLYGASSCATYKRPEEFPTNRSSRPSVLAGGIVEFRWAGLSESELADRTRFRLVAGGFFDESFICSLDLKVASKIAGVGKVRSYPDKYFIQRKINITSKEYYESGGTYSYPLGAKSLWQANDIFNPVSLEIDPAGNILFVNQYSEASHSINNCGGVPTVIFTNNYTHGVYRLNRGTKDIEAVTNPLSYGGYTIPVEGAKWYAPGLQLNDDDPWIEPWEAPLKNVPHPAVGGLVLSYDLTRLYTTSPYIPSGVWYSKGGYKYRVGRKEGKRIGHIYRIKLDTDGDGIYDFRVRDRYSYSYGSLLGGYYDNFGDPDLDGDGVINEAEGFGSPLYRRNPFCPEVLGMDRNIPCRITERIGIPSVYFFTADRAVIEFDDTNPQYVFKNGVEGKVNYIEYPLINSVSELGINGTRPQPWAYLLNMGDIYSGEEASKRWSVRAKRAFQMNQNGPIVTPGPLHTFTGPGGRCNANSINNPSCRNNKLSIGAYWDFKGHGLFGFPIIMASTTPLKGQVRATNWNDSDPDSSYTNVTGPLCYTDRSTPYPFKFDYTQISNYTDPNVSTSNYKFERSSLNLSLINSDIVPVGGGIGYTSRGLFDLTAYYGHCIKDSDYTEFLARRASRGIASNGIPYNKRVWAGVEPLVLNIGSLYSPPTIFTGVDGSSLYPSNKRLFYLMDHDGNGIRTPTWLNRDIFFSRVPNGRRFYMGLDPALYNPDFRYSMDPRFGRVIPYTIFAGGIESKIRDEDHREYRSPLDYYQEVHYPISHKEVYGLPFPLNPKRITTVVRERYAQHFRFQDIYKPSLSISAALYDPFHNTLEGVGAPSFKMPPRNDGFIEALSEAPLYPVYLPELFPYRDAMGHPIPDSSLLGAVSNKFKWLNRKYKLPSYICPGEEDEVGLVHVAVMEVIRRAGLADLHKGCISVHEKKKWQMANREFYVHINCDDAKRVCTSIKVGFKTPMGIGYWLYERTKEIKSAKYARAELKYKAAQKMAERGR